VIALFRSDVPSYIRRLDTAVKRRDASALRMAAHGLKGALATIGSPRGRELAAELEAIGTARRFAEAGAKMVRLRDHLTVLEQAFESAGLLNAPRTPSKKPARRAARRPAAPRKRRSS
jgi:HPt (histidine-containing phosphotransfer) domain-containing protein